MTYIFGLNALSHYLTSPLMCPKSVSVASNLLSKLLFLPTHSVPNVSTHSGFFCYGGTPEIFRTIFFFFLVCVALKVVFKTGIFSASSWFWKWFREAQGRKQNRDRRNTNTLSVIKRLCFRQLEFNSTEIFQETIWSISQNHFSETGRLSLIQWILIFPWLKFVQEGLTPPYLGFTVLEKTLL